MYHQKILVPYDNSEHAKSALRTAKELALDHDDTMVCVLNVVPPNIVPTLADSDPLTGSTSAYINYENYEGAFKDSIQAIRNEMMENIGDTLDGLPEDRVIYDIVSHPSPVHGITEYAENAKCDLIVMGRRGLGAFRGLLGSVSHGVLRSVDIPVMTVK